MTRAVDQDSLMRFSPATGAPHPYPSEARQWRHHHGSTAWLFNPWTGERRTPEDVGSDTFGYLIRPSHALLQAGPEESALCQCGSPMSEGAKYCSQYCMDRFAHETGESL